MAAAARLTPDVGNTDTTTVEKQQVEWQWGRGGGDSDTEAVSAVWRTIAIEVHVIQLHRGEILESLVIEMCSLDWQVNLLRVVCLMSKEQGRG